jgi:hypothetical protein
MTIQHAAERRRAESQDREGTRTHDPADAFDAAEALALDPQIVKGEDYRKFLKDNEQATRKLMNW